LRVAPSAAALTEGFVHVRAWMDRVDALGHGDLRPLDPAGALAVARTSTPQPGMVVPGEPNGLAHGDTVAVTPDDYGFDPVRGVVVGASVAEIAIRRVDPNLGDVVVHFPRVGFRVTRG